MFGEIEERVNKILLILNESSDIVFLKNGLNELHVYIKSLINNCKEYSDIITKLEKDNEKLLNQLAELEKINLSNSQKLYQLESAINDITNTNNTTH